MRGGGDCFCTKVGLRAHTTSRRPLNASAWRPTKGGGIPRVFTPHSHFNHTLCMRLGCFLGMRQPLAYDTPGMTYYTEHVPALCSGWIAMERVRADGAERPRGRASLCAPAGVVRWLAAHAGCARRSALTVALVFSSRAASHCTAPARSMHHHRGHGSGTTRRVRAGAAAGR